MTDVELIAHQARRIVELAQRVQDLESRMAEARLHIICCGGHRGDYALNDWAMHHCDHSDSLSYINDPDTGQLLCGQCGKVFQVEPL